MCSPGGNHNRFHEEGETMKAAIRIVVLAFALAAVANPVRAQSPAALQPSVWAAKPDVAGFDKSVDEHLAAADRSVQALLAVKGNRTVENTLQPLDDAVREIDTAVNLAGASRCDLPRPRHRGQRQSCGRTDGHKAAS